MQHHYKGVGAVGAPCSKSVECGRPFSLALVSRNQAAICVLCQAINTSRMVQNWQTPASDLVVITHETCVWVSHDLSLHVEPEGTTLSMGREQCLKQQGTYP